MNSPACTVTDRFASLLWRSEIWPNPDAVQRLVVMGCQYAVQMLGATSGKLWFYEDGHLDLAVIYNLAPALLNDFGLLGGEGLTGIVARGGGPLTVEDMMSDGRTARLDIAEREGLHGFVAVPIKLRSELTGVLSVLEHRPRLFTETELSRLKAFADGLALGIHHCISAPEMVGQWLQHFQWLAVDGSEAGLSPAKARTVERVKPGRQPPLALPGLPVQWPKGIHPYTMAQIYLCLKELGRPLSSKEVADRTGISIVTTRRYLACLSNANIVAPRLRYGAVGRPEYEYRLGSNLTPNLRKSLQAKSGNERW